MHSYSYVGIAVPCDESAVNERLPNRYILRYAAALLQTEWQLVRMRQLATGLQV